MREYRPLPTGEPDEMTKGDVVADRRGGARSRPQPIEWGPNNSDFDRLRRGRAHAS